MLLWAPSSHGYSRAQLCDCCFYHEHGCRGELPLNFLVIPGGWGVLKPQPPDGGVVSCWDEPALIHLLCSVIGGEQPAEAWHKCDCKSREGAAGAAGHLCSLQRGHEQGLLRVAQPLSGGRQEWGGPPAHNMIIGRNNCTKVPRHSFWLKRIFFLSLSIHF